MSLDVLPAPRCACGGDFDLSQPDADRPERLLGVCTECGEWSVVLAPMGGDAGVVPIRLGKLGAA